MKKLKLILFLLVIGISFITIAQNEEDPMVQGDKEVSYNRYLKALPLYQKALSKAKDEAKIKEATFKIGYCYKMMLDNKRAEEWFKKVVDSYEDPIVKLYYADALRANGKYADAIIQYEKYKEKVPNDEKANIGIESCKLAQRWKDAPLQYNVKNVKELNSEQDDFSPYFEDNKTFKTMIITSSRPGSMGESVDAWTGQYFSDLYSSKRDMKGKWSSPTPLSAVINTPGHEGAACFNEERTELYFTRCEKKKKKQLGCNIMVSYKKGNEWSEPELIKMTEDTTGVYTFGHPSITKDGLELYFASDMPGGMGGRDIWVIKRSSKSEKFSGTPQNLGKPVNTELDEVYLYIVGNVLYFASNGHIGMGMLDIYRVEKKGDGWGEVENMKPPINSPGDDFSIIFEGNNFSKGYFASDRPGGKGGMDIYMFEKAPLVFTLKGIVADDSTNQPLENVLVRLKGSDGTTVETKTDKTGMYSFDKKQIKENTTYEIATVMDGYFATTAKETTVGLTESKDLVHDLKIKRMPPPEKAIELPEIYYEYDKWNLVDSSKKALDGLIAIMKENPHMVIELSSHTDSRGTDEYNNELSQKRAQSVVDYLISKGIERDRMIAKGYGKTKLKINCTECTEEQHQQNRRTEFRILSNDYIPGKGSKTQKELQQQQKKNKK